MIRNISLLDNSRTSRNFMAIEFWLDENYEKVKIMYCRSINVNTDCLLRIKITKQ